MWKEYDKQVKEKYANRLVFLKFEIKQQQQQQKQNLFILEN